MANNRDVIRGLYESFAKGDVPSVLGAFAPDISWTEAEGFPYAGTYNGPDAVLQNVFMKLATEWNGFSAVPSEIIAEGDTVISIGEYGGAYKATGKPIKVPFAHVWNFRDGKIVRFRQFTDTAIVQRALQR